MRTIQVKLDEELVTAMDEAAEKLGTTRSSFAREAVRAALARFGEQDLERRHVEGYRRHPVEPGEFEWEDEPRMEL